MVLRSSGDFFIRQVDIWTTRRASSTLVNRKHLCGTVSRFLQVFGCSLQVEGEVSKQAENRIGRQQKSRNGNKIKRRENTGKEEMKGVGKSRQGERKRTLRTEAKGGWCTEQCGLSVVLPEKEFLNQHSLFFTDPSPLCHSSSFCISQQPTFKTHSPGLKPPRQPRCSLLPSRDVFSHVIQFQQSHDNVNFAFV